MATQTEYTSGGIGLGGLLLLLFIGLKLTGHIDWSWWWVFAPVWVPLAVFVGVATVFGLAFLAMRTFERRRLPRPRPTVRR